MTCQMWHFTNWRCADLARRQFAYIYIYIYICIKKQKRLRAFKGAVFRVPRAHLSQFQMSFLLIFSYFFSF
jgi:hypothetical protein